MHDRKLELTVERAAWDDDGPTLRAIRTSVFCDEQGCPAELEDDGRDPSAQHVLATWNGQPVGAGRLLRTGKITRMAVLATHRRRGIGREILSRLLKLARADGMQEVYLHAQLPAIPFYETAGFIATGPVFHEADMPHRKMTRKLEA